MIVDYCFYELYRLEFQLRLSFNNLVSKSVSVIRSCVTISMQNLTQHSFPILDVYSFKKEQNEQFFRFFKI